MPPEPSNLIIAQTPHLRDDALNFVKPTVFLLQYSLQLVDARQRVDLALQPE